jgi:hypothetical protein
MSAKSLNFCSKKTTLHDNSYRLKCTQTHILGGPVKYVHLGYYAKNFESSAEKMQNYMTHFVTRNALKLTYSDVGIQNFRGNPRTPAAEGKPRLTRQEGERLTHGR